MAKRHLYRTKASNAGSHSALGENGHVKKRFCECEMCGGPLPCIGCAQKLAQQTKRAPDEFKTLEVVYDTSDLSRGVAMKVVRFMAEPKPGLAHRKIIGPLRTEAEYGGMLERYAVDALDEETDPKDAKFAEYVRKACLRIRQGKTTRKIIGPLPKAEAHDYYVCPAWDKHIRAYRAGAAADTPEQREAAMLFADPRYA